MATLSDTHTVVLAARPERVWALVTAVRLWPLWLRGVDAVKADGRAGPGMRFMVQRAGQPLADRWIVAEWQPPRMVRFTDYGRNIQLTLELEERGVETRVTARLEWPRPSGLFGALLGRATAGGRLAHGLQAALLELQNVLATGRDQAQ